jgi:hypothetical protein
MKGYGGDADLAEAELDGCCSLDATLLPILLEITGVR